MTDENQRRAEFLKELKPGPGKATYFLDRHNGERKVVTYEPTQRRPDASGAFVRLHNDDREVWERRRRYLAAIADVAPVVLDDLFDDVFASTIIGTEDAVVGEGGHGSLYRDETALVMWAKGHNLDYDWAHETAAQTIAAWALDLRNGLPSHALSKVWTYPKLVYEEPELNHRPPFMQFENDIGWRPTRETELNFRRRALAILEAELDAYCAEVSTLYEAAGYVRVEERKVQDGDADREFRWAAQRFMGVKSVKDIARDYCAATGKVLTDDGEETVRKRTNKVAEWLGLKERPETPRRPKSTGPQG